jgi:hypothetical protein
MGGKSDAYPYGVMRSIAWEHAVEKITAAAVKPAAAVFFIDRTIIWE